MRLGFVHVPTTDSKKSGQRLSTLLYQLMANKFMSKIEPRLMKELLREIDAAKANENVVDTGNVTEGSDGAAVDTEEEGWSSPDLARAAEFWKVGAKVAKRLNLKSDGAHLLVNGRVSGFRYQLTRTAYWAIDICRVCHRGLCQP